MTPVGSLPEQIRFGKSEACVRKTRSQQTKKQKRQSLDGFSVDIAVFDDACHVGDPQNLVFGVEGKQPNETAGVAQLEAYSSANLNADVASGRTRRSRQLQPSSSIGKPDGSPILKRQTLSDVPRPPRQ
jgi:hypothetical protein